MPTEILIVLKAINKANQSGFMHMLTLNLFFTFIKKLLFKRERCNLTEFDFCCRNVFVECFVFAL